MATGTRTTLSLVDQMTAPIMAINNAINLATERFNALENASNIDASSLAAMKNQIDISNSAAEMLNQTYQDTLQNIDAATGGQERFNDRIRQGNSHADGLTKKVMGMVAAYASLRSVEKVLNVSDKITQTTARLNMIVDDGGTVEALQDKIFLANQRARGDYLETSNAVAKLGVLAGHAFSGNDEIIAFTELMNKQFKIGGQEIQAQTAAMRQLTQAMASGRLQGDEYVSVMENAPLLGQAIADNMGKSIEEMKKLSSKGLITADVVKGALFSIADETNERFGLMPMTFAEIGNDIKSKLVKEFEPVLNKLNEIGNSEAFKNVVSNLTSSFATLAGVATLVIDMLVQGAQFIADNWSIIAPVVYGAAIALGAYIIALGIYNTVQAFSTGLKKIHAASEMMATGATFAATAAQYGFNAALLACPITWIIIAIIAFVALLYLVVAWINKVSDTSISATGIIMGYFSVWYTHIYNIFVTLWNHVASFIEFFINVWHNPLYSIQKFFVNIFTNVLDLVSSVASAIDMVLHTDLSGKIDNLSARLAASLPEEPDNYINIKRLEQKDLSGAWEKGYSTGEKVENAIKNFDINSLFGSNIPKAEDYLAQTAYNTGVIKDELSDSGIDIKYLRDIAERDVVNRFTTAEVKVSFGDINNNVNSEMDLDGIVTYIEEHVTERLQVAAEGVY